MAFPTDVTETKNRLEEAADSSDEKNLYLKTLCLLTEPRKSDSNDPTYIKDYEDMWRTIQKHSHPDDLEDGHWVICFVNAVRKASNLHRYYYLRNDDKKELIKTIQNLTKELSLKLSTNDLDAHLVLNNQNLVNLSAKTDLKGVYIYEDLYDIERSEAGSSEYLDEIRDDEVVLFSKVLKHFTDRTIRSIDEASKRKVRQDGRLEAKYFIRRLVQHNKISYETPLNKAVATATFAIYGISYPESEIRNITKR